MKNLKVLFYIKKIDILYNAKFRLLLAYALYGLSVIVRLLNPRRADVLLMKSHHYSDSEAFQTFLNPKIKKIMKKECYIESLLPNVRISRESLRQKYLFIAKPYKGPREKGVIILMYTVGYNAFFRQYDIERLSSDYYIILGTGLGGILQTGNTLICNDFFFFGNCGIS